jgi:hypothetical protein
MGGADHVAAVCEDPKEPKLVVHRPSGTRHPLSSPIPYRKLEVAVTMNSFELVCSLLFALAIVHTFSTKYFEHLAHLQPRHAGLWHWLGEVEVVFGFWALVLAIAMYFMLGSAAAVDYIDNRNYTEPMFVFAVMVIAATRPILQAAKALVQWLARAVPLGGSLGYYLVVMVLVPADGLIHH